MSPLHHKRGKSAHGKHSLAMCFPTGWLLLFEASSLITDQRQMEAWLVKAHRVKPLSEGAQLSPLH